MNTRAIIRGGTVALPVILGYIPVGFTFGILAVNAGFSPIYVGLMSLLVYAGSGQIIAVGLVAAGAPPLSVILTTGVVNLRHLLMSAAMVPYLKRWSKTAQTCFGLQMTDETFAIHYTNFARRTPEQVEVFATNIFSHTGWCFGGIAGAYLGQLVGDITRWGLDYALPAMFIALLIPHIEVPKKLLAIIMAGLLSISFTLMGIDQWSVMLATLITSVVTAALPMPATFKKTSQAEENI